MSSRLKLAGIVLLGSFALAACGGGGGGTATTEPPPTTTEPPAPTAAELALEAREAGEAVAMAGANAMKNAAKYVAMVDARSAKGSSMTASDNAQMVLDAESDLMTAISDAKAARDKAMAAKDGASEDDMASLDSAIEAADAGIKAAEANLRTVQTHVRTINFLGTTARGPAKIAEEVSAAVKAAFASTITRTDDAASAPMGAIMNDGAKIEAMTWAMIAGEDNVMKKRLGTIDTTGALTPGNAEVSVASLEGMTATDVTATTLTDGTIDADGGTTPGSYKGILGAVVCLGGSDGCKVTDGKLGAGWYFSPAAPTTLYDADPANAGMYKVATLYARYGYWLNYADAAATTPNGITLYSAAGATGTNTTIGNLNIGPDENGKEVTARYGGSAVGISVWDKRSGEFTANVNLTAKFGGTAATPAAMLSGYISGFSGHGANPAWRVTLTEAAITTGSFADGATAGGGAGGTWTGTAYGPAPVDHDGAAATANQNQRPEGFFGTFNANFADGMAAGAYATRAD